MVLESIDEGRGVRVAEVPEEAEVVHTYWFAWAAFWPESELHGHDNPPDSGPSGSSTEADPPPPGGTQEGSVQ